MYVRNDANIDAATRKALKLAIDDCPDGALRRCAILNLNHPALVAARKAALDMERTRLERDLLGRGASRAVRANRAAKMQRQDPAPAYVSIRVGWLRYTLGKGR